MGLLGAIIAGWILKDEGNANTAIITALIASVLSGGVLGSLAGGVALGAAGAAAYQLNK